MSARPGGWVPGIGWVALLDSLAMGDRIRFGAAREGAEDEGEGIVTGITVYDPTPVIVTRWADGSTPSPVESEGESVSVPLTEWEALNEAIRLHGTSESMAEASGRAVAIQQAAIKLAIAADRGAAQ